MNNKKIEYLWKKMIKEIGDDPNREGLKDTPKRIAKMYEEMFSGYKKSEKKIIRSFKNKNDDVSPYDNIICDTGYFYSNCEHHGVPFFGKYYFGYIPNKRLIGLSKVARVIDFYCARLQVQERLTKQIVNEIEKALNPRGVILILKGRHICKQMRGVKKVNGYMITIENSGCFKKNKNGEKEDFMRLVGLLVK